MTFQIHIQNIEGDTSPVGGPDWLADWLPLLSFPTKEAAQRALDNELALYGDDMADRKFWSIVEQSE